MQTIREYVEVFFTASLPYYFSNDTMIGQIWTQISASVWSETIWLPSGVVWDDLRTTKQFTFPNFYDVWIYPHVMAAGFIVLRYMLIEPYLLIPLARSGQVKNYRPRPPTPNKILEAVHQQYFHIAPQQVVLRAAKASGLTTREVERWLRYRYKSVRFNKYDMFLECGYEVVCHTFLCLSGWVILYSKPWVWNLRLCWENYPYHPLDNDVWWYYLITLSYYWATSLTEIFKKGRKPDDRVKRLLHHLCTILLVTFSWICNFVRIGTVVMIVHECADIPLLTAKIFNYSEKKNAANVTFSAFLVLWIVTRCLIYPFWVMHSVFFEATTYMFMPSAYFFMGLLTILLLLNLTWTVLVISIVVRKFQTKSDLQDFRSSSEEEDKNNAKND